MGKRKDTLSFRRRYKLTLRKAGTEPTFTAALEDLLKKSPKPKRKVTLPVRAPLKKAPRARVARRAAARAVSK